MAKSCPEPPVASTTALAGSTRPDGKVPGSTRKFDARHATVPELKIASRIAFE